MIHLNALGLTLQQTFLVLTTKSGSSSLLRLFWTEPIIQYQLKFCYQVSQESVRTPWHTWYSVFWQRPTVCLQTIQRICIRLAFWPPNVLATLSTIKWQNWKCCKDSQEVTNQSKGKWTRSIPSHFRLVQHTFNQYWIITSTKIVWTTHKDTVTYSRKIATTKDHGGNRRQAQRKKDETSTVLQQRNKRAFWASIWRHSAHKTAAVRQRKAVEKGDSCQASSTSLLRGRSPRNYIQER